VPNFLSPLSSLPVGVLEGDSVVAAKQTLGCAEAGT